MEIQNETPPIIPKIKNPQEYMQFPMQEKHDAEMEVFKDDNPDNPFADFNIRRDSEQLQRQY